MKLQAGGNTAVRAVAILLFALALCIGVLGLSGQASAGVPVGIPTASGPGSTAGKVERAVLDDTANGKSASFIILMSDQANVTPAYGMKDQDARGWYVYNTLKSQADKSQASIRAMLRAQGISYQSFWIVNALVVTGNRALVDAVAARADVGKIEANRPFKGISDPVDARNAIPMNGTPNTVEWNVQNVNAPQVWAMGYTGQGIVIGNADTGMRWTHNALKPHYRGWNGSTADHNYNWWDAIHTGGGSCGPDSQFPCDDYGHGTHTTGTTSGDDGTGNQIGVAPGAKWIGCRNMDVGAGTPARYTECFQFMAAPTDLTGGNPNPALRAHVINNSWECTSGEGCGPLTLQTVVENTQAAGVFVEASAGNSGSGCSTVSNPPAIYAATFSTGAIDSGNNLVGFSSRGPVTADGSNRLKPNISAPGSGVRSSYYSSDSSYASLSGTSMAGPHVVGVVALLWSAHPELSRMITETKNLLQNTANPNVIVNPVQTCGGIPSNQIPNNSFGYGRVDALAAVNGGGPSPTPTATNTIALTATRTPTGPATNTPTPASTCGPSFGGIQITNFTFSPQNITVYSGATVRWVNFDAITHTTTSDVGVWDSGNLGQFGFFQFVFNTPGTYPYHCAIHTVMTGTVTVLSSCPPTNTPTRTITVLPTNTPTRTVPPTITVPPTFTFTPIRTPTGPATNTPTITPSPPPGSSNTPTATQPPGATNTATPCAIPFTDVHPTDYFYNGVRYLYCKGAISGYAGNVFLPFNNTTRGQLTKIVVLGYSFPIYTPPTPTFTDVPTTYVFYTYIETAYHLNLVSGYSCGTGCLQFRPGDNVTRAQLSKIVVQAAGWTLINPTTAHFSDVPHGSTFYQYIETAFCHGIISGYADGTFKPSNPATRGQICKIVYEAILNHSCTPPPAKP